MLTQKSKTITLLLLAVLLLVACQPAASPASDPTPEPTATAIPAQPTPSPTEETMPIPETPVSAGEDGTRGTLPEGTPAADEPARPLAYVDSAVLQTDDNGAPSVRVVGNLADGCTELADVSQAVVDERLIISLYTSRDPNLMCTQALVPFETTVAIDAPVSAQDLTSGRISVAVNGVMASQAE